MRTCRRRRRASHARYRRRRPAPGTRKALAPARSTVPPEVPDALLQRGLMAWAALFGQLHGIVGDQPEDHQAFFAESVRRWAAQVGIAPNRTAPEPGSPDGSWRPPETETTTTAQVIENSASRTAKEVSS